jgi:hypothetical protein
MVIKIAITALLFLSYAIGLWFSDLSKAQPTRLILKWQWPDIG